MRHLQSTPWGLVISLLLGFGTFATSASAQQIPIDNPTPLAPSYTLLDLGTLGGTASAPTAIDSFGNVVGYSSTADGSSHAFYYEINTGLMADLGTLGGATSLANALNDNGTVVGTSELASGSYHAFSYINGALTDLGALDDYNTDGVSYGQAIDSNGNIVGYSHTANGDHGFLYSGGFMADLGIDASTVHAYSLNDAGTVTGTYDASGTLHAFTFNGGVVTDLGTLGGQTSFGQHVNQAGDVVGSSDTIDRGVLHAFLYTQGVMSDLGTLGGSASSAQWINNFGLVTGASLTFGDAEQHAYLYDGAQMSDLNKRVTTGDPLAPFVTLQQGVAINDGGSIAAIGIDSRTGEVHAYLVQPLVMMNDIYYTTYMIERSNVSAADSSSGGGAMGLLELGSFLLLIAGRRWNTRRQARTPQCA
jgi:probable HAF family extracellular repeat protein